MFPILVLEFLMFLGLIPFHFSSACTCECGGGCTGRDVCMYVWYALCAHVCVGPLAGMYVCMYVLCMCVHMCVGPLTGMYICICYACKGALGCVCVVCICVHMCEGHWVVCVEVRS